MNKTLLIIIVSVLVSCFALSCVVFSIFFISYSTRVNSYDECVKAGYPIMESYPERCKTPDGRIFTNSTNGNGPQVGAEVIQSGELVCLPHKIKEGPQTLECAYGLLSVDGNYYGLTSKNFEEIFEFDIGEEVIVNGLIVETPKNNIYDIVETIEINSIKPL